MGTHNFVLGCWWAMFEAASGTHERGPTTLQLSQAEVGRSAQSSNPTRHAQSAYGNCLRPWAVDLRATWPDYYVYRLFPPVRHCTSS